MRLMQDGMFLVHKYAGTCLRKLQTGTALHGYSCGNPGERQSG